MWNDKLSRDYLQKLKEYDFWDDLADGETASYVFVGMLFFGFLYLFLNPIISLWMLVFGVFILLLRRLNFRFFEKTIVYNSYVSVRARSSLFHEKQNFNEYARYLLGWFLSSDWKSQKGFIYVETFIAYNRIDSLYFSEQDTELKEASLGIRYFYGRKGKELLKTLVAYSLESGSYEQDEKKLHRLAHYLGFNKETYDDVLMSVYSKHKEIKFLPYIPGISDSNSYDKYVNKYKKYESYFNSDYKRRYFCNKKPELMDVALRLFSMVVKADRQQMVCEIDVVRDFVRKNDGFHFSQRMNEFSQYLNYNYVLEDIAFAAVWFHKHSVYAIVQTMAAMAYSDLDFCEAEMKLLRRAASAMHLNSDEYDKILKDVSSWAEKEKKRKEEEETKNGYWTTDAHGNRKFNYFSDSEKTGDTAQSQLNLPYELRKAYDVLGIPYAASISEIKACKRNLMRVNHPDVVANRGTEAVEAATIKCQEINKAFEVVKKYRNI